MAATTSKRIAFGVVAIIILAGLGIFFLPNGATLSKENSDAKATSSTHNSPSKLAVVAQVEAPRLAPVVAKNDASLTNGSLDSQPGAPNSGSSLDAPPPPSPPTSRGLRGQMPNEWDVINTYPNGTVETVHRVRQEQPPVTQPQQPVTVEITSMLQNNDGTRSFVLSNGSVINVPKGPRIIMSQQQLKSIADQGGPAVVAKRDGVTIVISNHDGTATATRPDGSTSTYPSPDFPNQ